MRTSRRSRVQLRSTKSSVLYGKSWVSCLVTSETRMRKRRIPSLCLHRASGRAVVRLGGADVYCGPFGTAEAQEKYDRVVAEWLLTCRPAATVGPSIVQAGPPAIAVGELILAYWDRHVATYYVKKGQPTSEQDNVRQALRFLRRLYGSVAACEFGPLALKATRQAMIDAGRCRSLFNKDVGRVCGMFKWATAAEILPVTVYQALATLPGLLDALPAGALVLPPWQRAR